jgi:hypothetical protein
VYGDSLTLPGPITSSGTTVWIQKKAVVGDTIGVASTRAQISLPQDGIVSV